MNSALPAAALSTLTACHDEHLPAAVQAAASLLFRVRSRNITMDSLQYVLTSPNPAVQVLSCQLAEQIRCACYVLAAVKWPQMFNESI